MAFPMDAQHWEIDTSSAELVMHRGVTAIKNKPDRGFQAFLKNYDFTDGTIEFDVELTGMGFPGINFRSSPDRKNGENFYIRSFGKVNKTARQTLQYAPLIDGMSMWDLCDEYQAGAEIKQEGWNHVKLVVSGRQMRAYVNDMSVPALEIPELESTCEKGGISLTGNVIYANFKITPDATGGLPAAASPVSFASDTRYLRKWLVTEAVDFPFGKDLVVPLPSMYGTLRSSDLPGDSVKWKEVPMGNRPMVNVSQLYGHTGSDSRRFVYIKTSFNSEKTQEKTLRLGFSDEVWVFVNGELTYVDKNYFGTPSQKFPDGRCTIENSQFRIKVKEGKNEILIGLANYFYGWGIVARLDDVNGIN